jgi:serine/threonine-protein kinase
MSHASSYTGRLIADRFEVSASLGEGACGTVWVARDRLLGIPVAVKVLRSTMRIEPKRRAAFEREARLCERMLSPNIVRVIAFGVDEGDVPYIVYELLTGSSLQQRLTDGGMMPLDEVETTVVQIARGLARAHSLGVAHRDIKPSNVFLTLDDREKTLAKILDFGIASLTGNRATQGEDLYGTLEYIAPELLFQTAEADARSDLYALTVVAYECLTGRPPLEVSSVNELVVRMAKGPVVPASVANVVGRAAAEPLDAWFKKGLDKDPLQRFQSARDLAEELHRAVKLAKGQNPLLRTRPTTREMPAVSVETPASEIGARLAAGQKLPAMRPRMPSFVFEAFEEPEPAPVSVAPVSSVGRVDPRRE